MRNIAISNLKNLYNSVEFMTKFNNIKFTPFKIKDDLTEKQIQYINSYLCNIIKHPHYQYLTKGINMDKIK